MPYKDPEQQRKYHREYKRRNRHIYRARDKAWGAARHANMRAEKHGVPGRITADDAEEILSAGACAYCGSSERLGLDHVVAMARGGPNDPSNIVCCCHSCNSSKYRGTKPWRWSRKHTACVECGTTSTPHSSRGRCRSCDSRIRSRERRLRRPT